MSYKNKILNLSQFIRLWIYCRLYMLVDSSIASNLLPFSLCCRFAPLLSLFRRSSFPNLIVVFRLFSPLLLSFLVVVLFQILRRFYDLLLYDIFLFLFPMSRSLVFKFIVVFFFFYVFSYVLSFDYFPPFFLVVFLFPALLFIEGDPTPNQECSSIKNRRF